MAVSRWVLDGFYDTSTHASSTSCLVEFGDTYISVIDDEKTRTQLCQIQLSSVQKINFGSLYQCEICAHSPLRRVDEEDADSQPAAGEERRIFMDFRARSGKSAFRRKVLQMGRRYKITISEVKETLHKLWWLAKLNGSGMAPGSTTKRKIGDREAEELAGSKRRCISPARPEDLIDSSGRQPPNNSQKEQATSESCVNDDNGPLSVDKTTNGGESPLLSNEPDAVDGTEITDRRTSPQLSCTLRLEASEDNVVEHLIRELQGQFTSRGQQVQALTKEVERLRSHDEQLQKEMVEKTERAATFEKQSRDLQKQSALQLQAVKNLETAFKKREKELTVIGENLREELDKTKAQNQKEMAIVKELLKNCNPILALDVEKYVQLVRDGEKPQQAIYKASGAFSG